jgi:hypothetical protein
MASPSTARTVVVFLFIDVLLTENARNALPKL